ncbi:MAG TPA: lytic transglycosylase domain-containing protein [Polyangiaceae bacterium]
MTARGARWALAGATLGTALLVLYCAAPRPREVEPPSPPVAATAPAPRASASAVPVPVKTNELARERFTPLFARPGAEAVARALEEGDAKRAAAALDAQLAASPPAASERASFGMLAGLLHERAGEPAAALGGYELARDSGYPLSGYARAGRARMLVRVGRAGEAFAEAQAIPPESLPTALLLSTVGEAARAAGNRAAALEAARGEVAAAKGAYDRWQASLRLADALLGAGVPSGAGSSSAGGAPTTQQASEALSLARRVAAEAVGTPELARRAAVLAELALSFLPDSERRRLALPNALHELTRVEALVDARRYDDALTAASGVRTVGTPPYVPCRLELARGKALAGKRDRKKAFEVARAAVAECVGDPALHARALYNAAKYAAQDGRYSDATRLYERVETEHRSDTLADDARLHGALAYQELGVEARFTELLSHLPDDYPDGDMLLEGLFRLAVRRIDKGDWSAAASVLARAVGFAGEPSRDAARGGELAGRERYFQARAELALGQREQALLTFASIVRELPLSYYMLHAYGRLRALDTAMAEQARAAALEHARLEVLPKFPERMLADPAFGRAVELLRVGETDAAASELDALGLLAPGAGPELLWAVARLYARAGAEKLAHDVARRRLTDWLARWPAGEWLDAWQVAFPRPYQPLVEAAAKRQKLAPSIVYAVMREESAFDPDAESIADAYGLMQLIVPTARVAAKGTSLPHDRRSLKRPSVNIELGVRTLSRYADTFGGSVLYAVPAYNAGPGRVREWLAKRPSAEFDLWVELIPFLETRRYTKRVLASRAAYAFLYEPEVAEQALALPSSVQR